jgi:membrane dipeptidase
MFNKARTKPASAALLLPVVLFMTFCGFKGEERPSEETERDIHKKVLTVDSHCDTPLHIVDKNLDMGDRHGSDWETGCKIDLPRMKEGGLDAAFFVAYVGQEGRDPEGYREGYERANLLIDAIHQMCEDYPDSVELATTPEDAYRLEKQGKRAIYIGMENGYPIGKDLSLISEFYDRGVRYITLCHGCDNDICDSSTDRAHPRDDGLSEFGKRVVAECNRMGIIVDLSHASDQSFFDVLDVSKAPVIASHSGVRSLCAHPRNLSDEMIKALAANRGVLQICLVSSFIEKGKPDAERDRAFSEVERKYGYDCEPKDKETRAKMREELGNLWRKYSREKTELKNVIDHIDRVVKLVGVDHVGIGTDFDGGGGVIGCDDVTEIPHITEELLRRGYTEEDIRKIWGGNVMRVFGEVIEIAEDQKGVGNSESHSKNPSPLSRISEEAKTDSESWMGIYMGGIKVGYSHSVKTEFIEERILKSIDESWMRVTRLGSNPVEISTIQDTFVDSEGEPLKVVLRTKLSETETVMEAEVVGDKIVFRLGEKIIKELPKEDTFHFGVPIKKIIDEGGLISGKSFAFKILDLLSHSLVDGRSEVIGREEVLILGKKMDLWHIKTETAFVVPVTIEEWVDGDGVTWKSISRTGFLTSTSLRMPRERALAMTEENFDIAFSTVVKSNVVFENPQGVQEVTFRLSGIPAAKIQGFPTDGRTQKRVEDAEGSVILQTTSQVFREQNSISFPILDEEFQESLEPTAFCQADQPGIQKTAREIVEDETNAWKAAKKIAEWISRNITPTYDVGFATAGEILVNRKGDCTEHTVLMIALCRAVGIPARASVGIMYARGFFAYHMWPEVFVGRWVALDAKWLAVDKKTGEYYTDATHIKFGHSSLDEKMFKEMVEAISEIIGKIELEVLEFSEDR